VSALLWPGDDRAGNLLSDGALLAAMAEVEQAWLAALATSGIAPPDVEQDLVGLIGPDDLSALAAAAEATGNPVPSLLAMLRRRLGDEAASRWLHKGLTGQDVIDTALMITARAAIVLEALDDLSALRFPMQVGGAAGTLCALVDIGDPVRAVDCVAATVRALGLDEATPWHATRATVTRIGDAAVRCTDAWGRIANDVLTLSRPELGEGAEAAGGGSWTMPHKANPVLSTLVRRAALTAPNLGATLHLAAAEEVDERADGSWHVEWQTLATLVRRTVVAGAQTADLLLGLRVRPGRMAATLAAAHDDSRAGQRTMAALAGHPPHDGYLGLARELVDPVLTRAAEATRASSAGEGVST
jgi:3-carboxy-cis,cis-muconate cycloisomerase